MKNNKTPSNNLLDQTPQTVADWIQRGIITEDQGHDYLVHKIINDNGFLNLEPQDAAWAHQRGIISNQQAQDWMDFRDHPVKFRLKDVLGRAAVHAGRNFLQEGFETLKWLADGYEGNDLSQFNDEIPKPETAEPVTTTGKIVKGIEQTALGFMPGMGIAGKAKASIGVVKRFAFNSPFLYNLASTAFAGVINDSVFYSPYDKRLSNLIEENTDFGNAFTAFLKADPDDSVAEAKLKSVIEGATLGTAVGLGFEGITRSVHAGMAACKILKGRVMARNGNIAEDIAKDVDEHLPVKPLETDLPPEVPPKVVPKAEPAVGTGNTVDKAGEFLQEKLPIRQEGKDIVIDSHLNQQELQGLTDDLVKILKGDLKPETSEQMANAFRKIEGPEDMMAMVHHTADTMNKLGDNLRGDVWSDHEMQDLAADLGFNMNDFRKMFGNVMDMPIRIRAYMGLMTNYSKYVYDELAPKAIANGQEVEFSRAIQTLYEMQQLHMGVRASVGRSLRAYNETYTPGWVYPKITPEEYEHIMAAQGDQLRKLIVKTRQIKSDRARILFARQVGRMKWLDGALELTQASLVSGYKTQLVNFDCNLGVFAYESLLHNAAIAGRAVAEGNPQYLLRASSFWHGAWNGLKDAVRIKSANLQALKPEHLMPTIKAIFKNDQEALRSISKTIQDDPELGKVWKALLTGRPVTDAMEKIDDRSIIPDFPGLPLGSVIRLPFRVLTAADEFFKSISYRSSLHSYAFEQGYKQGMRGEDLAKFVEKVTTRISKDAAEHMIGHLSPEAQLLHGQSIQQARINTFSQELSPKFKQVDSLLSPTPFTGHEMNFWDNTATIASSLGSSFARIFFVPFFKIAANISRYAAGSTPLAVFGRRWADDMASKDPVKKIEALMRIMSGTAFMGLGFHLYKNGQVTGHIPAGQKDAASNAGITPYSFFDQEQGKWVDYNRLDPFGSLLAMGANVGVMVDLLENAEDDPDNQGMLDDYITNGLMVMSDPILNKAWAQGASELLNSVTDPERYPWKKWLIQKETQFIPYSTMMKDIQQHYDGVVREAYDYQDGILSRFDSKEIAPRRHPVFGNLQTYEAPFAGLLKTREATTDPVLKAMAEVNCNIQPLKRKVTFGSSSIELPKDMFIEYGELYGNHAAEIHGNLQKVIEDPWFQQSEDQVMKAGVLQKVVEGYRKAALGELYERHKDWFNAQIQEDVTHKVNANKGIGAITQKKTIPLSNFTKIISQK